MASSGKRKEIELRKRKYATPKLTEYGSVRTLTQSGTGTTNENAKCGGGPNKKNCNPSDRMTKQDIVRIGNHPLGFGLYLFSYRPEYRDTWGHGRQFGAMADEVEAIVPEAVYLHPDGYKMLDYAALGIDQHSL